MNLIVLIKYMHFLTTKRISLILDLPFYYVLYTRKQVARSFSLLQKEYLMLTLCKCFFFIVQCIENIIIYVVV